MRYVIGKMVHGTRVKIMVRLHNYGTAWQRCKIRNLPCITSLKGAIFPIIINYICKYINVIVFFSPCKSYSIQKENTLLKVH